MTPLSRRSITDDIKPIGRNETIATIVLLASRLKLLRKLACQLCILIHGVEEFGF